MLVRSVPHPYGITVAGDYIYWTDWQLGTVQRADKLTGQDHTTVATDKFKSLMDIHAIQLQNVGECYHGYVLAGNLVFSKTMIIDTFSLICLHQKIA